MSQRVVDNVVSWVHEGYPHGVPQQDYFPLLALLARSLSEDEVVKVAQSVLRSTGSGTAARAEIHAAIHVITAQEPDPEEILRVASGLASVGWPLAAPAR